MNSLLPSVRDLCVFRGSPATMPHSPVLLLSLLVLGVLIDVSSGQLLGIEQAAVRSLLSTGVVLALAWVALALRGFAPRFVQTASALTACSIVFSLLLLPFALLNAGDGTAAVADVGPAQVLLTWMVVALLLWKLAVDGHILRHALDMSLTAAIVLALLWAIAGFALDSALFVPSP